MKNLKLLILSLSFVMYNGALFSQIKSGKNVLKTDKISKTDIKLRSFTVNSDALRIDKIEGMSVEEISKLKIPRITPISPEVLGVFNTKTSWEVNPMHLDDGDLTLEYMELGRFTNGSFQLKPKVNINYSNYVISPSSLTFFFKQIKGEMYLLEIPLKSYLFYSIENRGIRADINPEDFRVVTIGINNNYQTHQVVDDVVNVVWKASSSDEIPLKIIQTIPDSTSNYLQLSCNTSVKSIKIRNITE